MDRRFKGKIITTLVLCICIVSGLIYLTIKRAINAKNEVKPTPTITATIEPTKTPISSPTPLPTPTPVIYDTESDESLFRIVNENQQIDKDYVPTNLVKIDSSLISVNFSHELRTDAYEALKDLYCKALEAGYKMRILSGYRSYTEQQQLFDFYVSKYGKEWAEQIDDKPGESEHQLGLCIDVGLPSGECDLDSCFANSGLYSWLHENAYKYGFIERYPEGKQSVTGIIYSPWHYRYVGKDMAEKIYISGLTMEEFFENQ